MAIFFIRERYEHGSGFLHRIDPCVKIVTVVLFAFAILASREGDWIAFAGFALFEAALAFFQFPGSGLGFAMAIMPGLILLYLMSADIKAEFAENGPPTVM